MSAISDGISKAVESAEGTISAERNIGKNKARGSIDAEGVWDIGIDFKVGGLGVTNDYGGAITVSIAGQSITWGREGGKIHYNVGGFEVIVEARDCVVTESKIIMGIVVASHTYPDPGCELPEEEGPIEPPELPPDDSEDGTEKLIGIELAYAVIDGNALNESAENHWSGLIVRKGSHVLKSEINGAIKFSSGGSLDMSAFIFNYTTNASRTGSYAGTAHATGKYFNSTQSSPYTDRLWPGLSIWNVYHFEHINLTNVVEPPSAVNIVALGAWAGIIFGPQNVIKNYVQNFNSKPENNQNTSDYYYPINIFKSRIKVVKVIPLKALPTPKPQPFLQPGVPPHMKDCCEDILDSLEDLKDVLHVEFFKKKKFPVPTYLLAPGCEPGKTTDAENYYHLFQKLFQTIAHTAIVSPQIDIQDADAVKEGDQKINERYLSATGWAEAVTKRLYEIEDDGNIATNMDIRTGVTVTQLLVAVADLSYKVDCIIDCIGVTTKRSKAEVETSYNLVVEGENTKGFDPKKSNQQLDLNSDISTEKLLAGLLRTRKNPIVKEEIYPNSPTLFELINDLKNK